MRKMLLVAAIAAISTPHVADACGNEVEMTVNDYVRIVAKAEKMLEAGQFGAAKRTLNRMHMPTAALKDRAADVKAVVTLRTTTDAKAIEGAAKHFKARSESKTGAKDVRFKAWHAESLIILGKKDEARALLVALEESDLMPDAYAFRALAVLSTGTERYEHYKACRTRAKNKEICELPAEKVRRDS